MSAAFTLPTPPWFQPLFLLDNMALQHPTTKALFSPSSEAPVLPHLGNKE